MSTEETPNGIAAWVINNRYPMSENDKISDAEMYHEISGMVARHGLGLLAAKDAQIAELEKRVAELERGMAVRNAKNGKSECCGADMINFVSYGYKECADCGKTYRNSKP